MPTDICPAVHIFDHITLAQFRATRTESADVARFAGLDPDDDTIFPGYTYLGFGYIVDERRVTPKPQTPNRYRYWTLTADGVECGSDDLDALEALVYADTVQGGHLVAGYGYISLQPIPQPLEEVLDQDSAINRGIRADMKVATCAPALLTALRHCRADGSAHAAAVLAALGF